MSNTSTGAISRSRSKTNPFFQNFLGHAPAWYKWGLLVALCANPVIFLAFGPFVVGWVMLLQFIATLALALYAFPLISGGLLLLEAFVLQLVPMPAVHEEIAHNMPILYLVLFVVTGVYFLKDLLSFLFIRIILAIRSEITLSLFLLLMPAFLSALLDALTVTAVVGTVLASLFATYHRIESQLGQEDDHDPTNDELVKQHRREQLEAFRAALRRLIMYALIGTMLGGIATLIGEPQNLLIGAVMDWHFDEFFVTMLPISVPVLLTGIVTCIAVEKLRWFDYGTPLTVEARAIFKDEADRLASLRTPRDKSKLVVQAAGFALLVTLLVLHITEVYVTGLIVLIFVTSFNGASEHDIGNGIKEGGAFVFVLAAFFGIVAMIHAQHLFDPVTQWVLSFEGNQRLLAYFASTGLLSAISDNVFVASLFITEAESLHTAGTIAREEFEDIAVAINMGTNIPSIATPNGQAAFLYLLMHPLAKLLKLSYVRMLILAAPFAVTCTAAGALAIWLFY
jgi:NhaB family Na+:H+ antiporter